MTAKPIVVLYLPEDLGNGTKVTMMDCASIIKYLEEDKPDYYWFCFPDYELTTPELKVFYEKDFTEIQYQELKTIIEESILKNNNIA